MPSPLFTYGTLQFTELMLAITGQQFPCEPAALEGYASYQVTGKPYPALLPEASSTTHGILYYDIDQRSLRRLDAYEGGIYQKSYLPVTLPSGKIITAIVYTTRAGFLHRVSNLQWDIQQFEKRWLNIYLRKCGLRTSQRLHA